MNATDAVSKGVALLDQRDPGWAVTVDRANLHVAGCCPLVQCFGSFAKGREALGLNVGAAIEHGFSWLTEYGACPEGYNASEYVKSLDAEWQQVVRERQVRI